MIQEGPFPVMFFSLEFGITGLKPVTLHYDNQSSIHITKKLVHHECTEHIDIDVHFKRNNVLEGLLRITYLPTSSQIAEVFTMILPYQQFTCLLSKLRMVDTLPTLRVVC